MLLFLSPLVLVAQGSNSADSVKYYIQEAKAAFLRAKAMRGRQNADLLFREDSAFMANATKSGDTVLVLQSRIWHAQNLVNYNQLPKAGKLLQETKPWLHGWSQSQYGWAEYYETLGHWNYKSFKFPEALANYQFASDLAAAKQDRYRYHRIQESIGTLWQLRGKSDSIQKVYDALDYYEKNNHPSDAVGAAKAIALGYAMTGNADQAIQYYTRALNHAQTARDLKMMASIQANLADLYLGQKKFTQALDAIRESIALYQQVQFTDGMALSELQQGRILTAMDDLAAAQQAFQRGDSINRIHPSRGVEMASQLYRAQWNLKQEKHRAADSLYATAAKTALGYVDPSLLRNATQKAAEGIPALKGNARTRDSMLTETLQELRTASLQTAVELSPSEREALLTLNPYTGAPEAEDSSLIRRNHQDMQEAEARFRLSEKRDSLQALQQAAVQAQTGRSKAIGLSIAALIVALGLAVLATLRYRQWKKADEERKKLALLKREAHHQAKNHLAVIGRLIDMTEKELEKPLAIKVLSARVKTLETLHQVLYQQETHRDLVAMGPYLDKLLPLLISSYTTAQDRAVALQMDVQASIPAPMASQLALLINELVTNSIKYAWKNDEPRQITLEIRETPGYWSLRYGDNGQGFPEHPGKGYGRRLIQGIIHTLQGNGGYDDSKDGVSFQCRWPKPMPNVHG